MDFIAKGTEVAKETEVIQVSEVAKGTGGFFGEAIYGLSGKFALLFGILTVGYK